MRLRSLEPVQNPPSLGAGAAGSGWGSYSPTVAGTFYDTGHADLIARNDAYGVLNEWANTCNAHFAHPLTTGW